MSARDITDENAYYSELKYSDELKSTILNTALDAIITINHRGGIQECNPAAKKIFAYDDDIPGKNIDELIQLPGFSEKYKNKFNDYLARNRKKILNRQFQTTALKSHGQSFPVEMNISELRLNDSEIYSVFIRDITERERIENDLIESEQRYRTIYEAEPECVKTIDADGCLIHMNPAGLNYIEADSLDQVKGACVYDLILPNYRDEFIELNRRVFKGETCDLQFKIEGLNGRQRWMDTHAVPIYDSENKYVIQHLAVTRDITNKIAYQTALKESEERFRSSFEHGPLGMGIGDKNGNIVQVNKALCEISGYSEEELLGKNFREFIHPDDIEKSVRNLQQLFQGEIEHYNQIRRYKHKAGHYVWMDISVSIINDADGQPSLLINHLQDITERINHEQLQKAQREILEGVIKGTSQTELLIKLCSLFESHMQTTVKASVLLLNPDDNKLYVGAAPSMSDELRSEFEGFMIGENRASCGTAAYACETVIVEDVSSSPLWADFKSFAEKYNFRACWSIPFFSKKGDVLGTFALSFDKPVAPTKYDKQRLKMAGYLASIVIEKINAETHLRESEIRFRSAFGNAPMGTALVDNNGVVMQANSRSSDIIGFVPEEIIGKSIVEVTHPDDVKESIERFKSLMSGEIEGYQLEKRYLHKRGDYVWCRLSISSIKDHNNKAQYAIAHIEDISERKQSEADLIRYNRELEMLNQCNHILFHATDTQQLLQQVCDVIIATGGYRFVWVAYAEKDTEKTISSLAKSGYENGYLNNKISWRRNTKNYCPVTEAIISLEPVTVRNIETEQKNIDWRQMALERDYKSTTAIPLKMDECVFGALVIYSAEADAFDDNEIGLLSNLADNLSYGIQSLSNKSVRTETENSLRLSEQNFRRLFDENPCMFFTVDDSAVILSVNEFGASELGYSKQQIIGRSLFSFTSNEKHFDVMRHLRLCIEDTDIVQRWEMLTVKKNGSQCWVRVMARAIEEDGQSNTVLVVCEDITEARSLSEQLMHQATHDELTGLINRYEFETRLNRALLSAQSSNHEHVLCYLDLDQFKIINDTCGHIAGDKLLSQLSEMLRPKIRHRDSLARLGGDEFGLLIENCTLYKAEQIADKIKQTISEFSFFWEEHVFKIGVSIGMVAINSNSTSISHVLMTADNACYAAKDKGRNRIHIHKEGDTELESRRREMLWTTRIQKAFEEERFYLVYQSIVPLCFNSNRGEHGEVLVRLQDEEGKTVYPDVFIPVAERYNLITKLDCHVIDMTFKWLGTNPEFLEKLYVCSINLSGQSLADASMLTFITEKLEAYNIPAIKICFEITETAAIANLSSAMNFINKLKEKGCRFALDDFGSGLSSFGYLKTLPVDFLKIDGGFVKDIENEHIDTAIVKSIHDIASALNKKTIAEFVENQNIIKILEDIGVNYAQGYAIERPKALGHVIQDQEQKNNIA